MAHAKLCELVVPHQAAYICEDVLLLHLQLPLFAHLTLVRVDEAAHHGVDSVLLSTYIFVVLGILLLKPH